MSTTTPPQLLGVLDAALRSAGAAGKCASLVFGMLECSILVPVDTQGFGACKHLMRLDVEFEAEGMC